MARTDATATLVRELQQRGLWDDAMIADIKRSEGSIQDIERIPADLREVYRTAWEIPQRALIDMAAERGAFIDQSQSLNLFMETPTIGKLSSMYLHAWKQGLKTTYYLRSRPATRINKATVAGSGGAPAGPGGGAPEPDAPAFTDEEAVACSLDYTRYDQVGEALGCHGEYVERPDDLRPALDRALAAGRPAIVNIKIGASDFRKDAISV